MKEPETILPIEEQQETKEILEFFKVLTKEEQKSFKSFMQGVMFVKTRDRV